MAKDPNRETEADKKKLYVAERMEARNMETKDLADAMGVSFTAAWRYQNGRRPKNNLIPKLADALECTVSQLYRHPDRDSEQEAFAGLGKEAIKDVRRLIEFHRWKSAKTPK